MTSRETSHNDMNYRYRTELAYARDPDFIVPAWLSKQYSTEESVSLLENTTAAGLMAAGDICLEQAARSCQIDEIGYWAKRAETDYLKGIRREKMSNGGHITPRSAHAMIQIDQLPLVLSFAAADELPKPKLVEKIYLQTVETARGIAAEYTKSRHDLDAVTRAEFKGLFGEVSVLLLAQRYGLRNHPDSSWQAYRALLSQDKRNRPHSSINRAWDLSIFTDVGDGPTMPYKVQVCLTQQGSHDRRFKQRDHQAEDISLLFVRENLFEYHKTFSAWKIINEVYWESFGNDTSALTEVLDQRTEKFLNVID